MGFFSRKKEIKVENIPQTNKVAQPVVESKQEKDESQFTSPEDLMKFNSVHMSAKLDQPVAAQSMETVKPADQMPQLPMQMRQLPMPNVQQEKQSFAPLFVKIDRYRNILRSLAELKTTLALAKSALSTLDQMERIKYDNLNLLTGVMNKIEKKLTALDSEFLRPTGFQEQTNDIGEVESLQGVISDLQSQIQELKNEMQQV